MEKGTRESAAHSDSLQTQVCREMLPRRKPNGYHRSGEDSPIPTVSKAVRMGCAFFSSFLQSAKRPIVMNIHYVERTFGIGINQCFVGNRKIEGFLRFSYIFLTIVPGEGGGGCVTFTCTGVCTLSFKK